ncbi:hypothetical protein R3P38DRAFT_2479934, partial [Favolaschia claudopus]
DDSDKEAEGTGDDFRAAPWIQGLAPLDRLREVFDIDAAQRGELEKCTESAIRAHNYKVDTDLGARAYDKLSRAFPELADLPARQRLQTQI